MSDNETGNTNEGNSRVTIHVDTEYALCPVCGGHGPFTASYDGDEENVCEHGARR